MRISISDIALCKLATGSAFNERAISWQKYVVQPGQYLRQWRQAGRADVAFARKHPQQAQIVFDLNGAAKLSNRLLWRPLASCQPLTAPLMNLLRWLALALVALLGLSPSPANCQILLSDLGDGILAGCPGSGWDAAYEGRSRVVLTCHSENLNL